MRTGLTECMRPWNVQEPSPSAEDRGKGQQAPQECEGLHFSLGLELGSESRRTGCLRLLLLRRDTMSVAIVINENV